MAQKVTIVERQIKVVASTEDGFLLDGSCCESLPWESLRGCYIYGARLYDLEMLLEDAALNGYHILSGFTSDRRSLRGFTVGLGAWGVFGTVQCRTADVWGVEVESDDLESEVSRIQETLQALCERVNHEDTPFRGSAFKWLSSLYKRMVEPLELSGYAETLPEEVAQLCRKAHIGGPVVHARSSIEPYVSIDRVRAYGTAMLEGLPVGLPADIPLAGNGLDRWTATDLMRQCGVAQASVEVQQDLSVPLLPILKSDPRFDRSRTIYPTGAFRGVWSIEELAKLEESGWGRVTSIQRALVFETRPIFGGLIRYLRRIEGDLPIQMKRLEHMLYGKCARGLSLGRIGSGPTSGPCVASDLLDDRSMKRVDGRIEIRSYGMRAGGGYPRHPLYKVTAQLSAQAERGTIDRPERSAVITARNRCSMVDIITSLDKALKPESSGCYIGRIYVDGIDIQATIKDIPELEGTVIKSHGPMMRIFRSGAIYAKEHNGNEIVEGAGLIAKGSCLEELEDALDHSPDADGGPFAAGRIWDKGADESDPRRHPGRASHAPHIDYSLAEMLGFSV
jgi:hypothetical protein